MSQKIVKSTFKIILLFIKQKTLLYSNLGPAGSKTEITSVACATEMDNNYGDLTSFTNRYVVTYCSKK